LFDVVLGNPFTECISVERLPVVDAIGNGIPKRNDDELLVGWIVRIILGSSRRSRVCFALPVSNCLCCRPVNDNCFIGIIIFNIGDRIGNSKTDSRLVGGHRVMVFVCADKYFMIAASTTVAVPKYTSTASKLRL